MNDGLTSLGDLRSAAKNGVDEIFRERIMLAVTEVNGCRYCSFFHTRQALLAGISKTEIKELISGEIAGAPIEQQLALQFAQHYAETAGQPLRQAVERLVETYGENQTRGIIANIRMIMIGNAYGNAFDALRHRMKGQPAEGSSLGQELGVLSCVAVLPPWMMIRQAVSRIFEKDNKKPANN